MRAEADGWAVSKTCVEPKGNAITITKQASGTAKIDPLVAAFNAIALMSSNPSSHQASSDLTNAAPAGVLDAFSPEA